MQKITLWVISIVLSVAFLAAGFAKLSAQPMMVAEFQSFSYPLWFMTVTGTLEVIGAVAVLVPRTALWGAGLLVCIMVGALISHLTHDQAGMTGLPLVLLILALVVAWLRTRLETRTVIA